MAFEIIHIITGRSVGHEADSAAAAAGCGTCRRIDSGAFSRVIWQRSGAAVLKSRMHFSSIGGYAVVSGDLSPVEMSGIWDAVEKEIASYIAGCGLAATHANKVGNQTH